MRPIPSSPPTFDGTLKDLFNLHARHVLPEPADVEHVHRRIVEHCRQEAPIFLVRCITGCERGHIYVTESGARFRPTDNSPAWWVHHLAFQGIEDFRFEDAPTHMFEIGRRIPQNINTAGWHVAHILNAKDGNAGWRKWSREDLVRRFVRNLHPANCFYIPKQGWGRYGGDPEVMGFFIGRYRERYHRIWDEFVGLVGAEPFGVAPDHGREVSYVYPLPPPVPAGHPVGVGDVAASYRSSRLCFKANVIEPLNPQDVFEVTTPTGIFRMTKA